MRCLFKWRLLTTRGIAIGGVIFVISSFPGIAIACEGAGLENYQLGPNAAETGGSLVLEPRERKEFIIVNHTGEEVRIRSWAFFNEEAPMVLDEDLATANRPRCSVRERLAAAAQCYFRVVNNAATPGGVGRARVEAEGANGWRLEFKAF